CRACVTRTGGAITMSSSATRPRVSRCRSATAACSASRSSSLGMTVIATTIPTCSLSTANNACAWRKPPIWRAVRLPWPACVCRLVHRRTAPSPTSACWFPDPPAQEVQAIPAMTERAHPLRICILETDDLRPEFVEQYRGYGCMFEQLFAHQPIPARFEIFNVVAGHYPDEQQHYDAYLVTGSKAD